MTRINLDFFGFISIIIATAMSCISVVGTTSYADDAQVLPKGVFRVTMDNSYYLPITKRYNPDGKVEDIATDYNANLNSNVFPALSDVENFFGMPAGSGTVGTSVVSFKYDFNFLDSSLQYGVTERLSIGMLIPYLWQRNSVKARLDSSNATIGKNPFVASLTPLGFPGTVPLTTDDVQNILGKGLDINGDGVVDIPGFKFKRGVRTWSGNGIGDIEAGFRYQYFRNRYWRLAGMGGARFPTGKVDDPDNLTDINFGDGAYALLFRLNNDFVISNLWKKVPEPTDEPPDFDEAGDLVLNYTFRYDLYLPDHEKKRIPISANNPLAINSETVKRDLGDIVEFEVSAKYTIVKGLSFSPLYSYKYKVQDQISGKKGLTYHALEDETKAKSHVYILTLSYSTVPLYIEKKFAIPLQASISYRNRFAGANNSLRSQYIGFGLHLYF